MEDTDFAYSDDEGSECPPSKHQRSLGPSPSSSSSPATQILTASDLDSLEATLVDELVEVVHATKDDAFIALTRFGWNLALVQQLWFEDGGSAVRTKAGCCESFIESSNTSLHEKGESATCPICLYDTSSSFLCLTACMHWVCTDCFRSYLSSKILTEGQESVSAKCPSFRCPFVVAPSLISHLLNDSEEDRLVYAKYLDWRRNAFVSANASIRWCPNPTGCGLAVRGPPAGGLRTQCRCEYVFCWECGKEAHAPVSCAFADKWTVKNSSESENVNWIVANTKPCPRCHRPIEKNQGCNHMTCSLRSGGCGTEFCWMCLQKWSSHGSGTGYYSCNLYDSKKGTVAEMERARNNSKTVLARYMFFFGRFMNHQKGGALAVKELATEIPKTIEILHEKFGLSISDLEFLQDALRQVAECRHVLKWTYVYGFYLSEIEGGETKELFEYLQTNLEELTDRLHEYIEKDLGMYVRHGNPEEAEGSASEHPPSSLPENREEAKLKFFEFRSQVSNQCNVTRKFFHKIVSDLAR